MAKKAFAVVAHPDDIEFLMAGTMILLGRAGYELHCMTVLASSLPELRKTRNTRKGGLTKR